MRTKNKQAGKKSRLWECWLAFMGSWLLRIWWRTLRYSLDSSVRELQGNPPPPVIALLWHNRLFAAPEFYRRFFKDRRLAALVSASGDGGWLAGFLEHLGIQPVRGSHHNRGAFALKECLTALKDGCDIAITPDGSRGPVYKMKPGAAALTMKTGAPVYLLDFKYSTALRLASWDRFFLPLPFSRVEVRLECVDPPTDEAAASLNAATCDLQARMDALIGDDPLPVEDR